MPSMNFILTGRDELSRLMDRAGDAAQRFGRRLIDVSNDGDRALAGLSRTADGRLRDVRGRFVSTGDAAGIMSAQFTAAGRKGQEFATHLRKGLLSLAPAAVPAAASMAPLLASVAAGGVAVAAFGAAVVPQIQALSEASEANTKYQDAVDKSGARSQAAVTAQAEYQRQLAKMPPEAREATVALSGLKDEYRDWSDDLAGDTMPVVTKSMGLFSGLLPKTTGLVRGTSQQLDRLMTIAAGGMQSPGFDRFMAKVEAFSTGAVRRAVDWVVRLSRAGQGEVGSDIAKFMDYARAQAPVVGETLRSLATALTRVLLSASEVGVGMLDVVNALAKLVAAVPPGLLTTLFQIAVALKAIRLASAGMSAVGLALAGVRTQIMLAGTAAAGATGRVARLRAGFAALGTTARSGLVIAAVAAVVAVMHQLGDASKEAIDVQRLTTALGEFGRTGRVTGELKGNLSELATSLAMVSKEGSDNKFAQLTSDFGTWIGLANGPGISRARENVDAVDKSLAELVRSGKGDQAAAAAQRLEQAWIAGGGTAKRFRSTMNDYQGALADVRFEQELAAQAQGLFGAQAQQTQAALAAQKASADGLRQSLVALNDVQRQGLSGMIGFEASIDAAAKAARENAGVLNMQGGKLDLSGEKSRAAATALNDLAAKTDEATASARESGASWQTVNGIYSKGRDALIKSAQAMGLTKAEAKTLADQILKTPDKTAKLKGNLEDLDAKLKAAKGKLSKVPDSRKAKVRAEIADLEAKIREARRLLDNVDGKTATTYVVTRFETKGTGAKVAPAKRDYATGGLIGFPGGGPIRGPGTGTSDSIPINASNGEYMINARSTAKYLPLIEAINADKLGDGVGVAGAGAAVAQGLAGGMTGSTGLVRAGARQMAAAVTDGIREELQISSPSKKTAALAKDIGRGLIVGLTGSRDKIRATAADLAADIRTAFSGRKESGLVRMVTAQTNRLLSLAARRDRIAARIAEAKAYASDVTKSAREGASLSGLGMEPEEVSAGTIKSGLAGKLAQIKTFTRYIDILAKKGLNRGLLRQILNMGPEAGYAYASALVGADRATFGQINKLQTQIDKSTVTLGQVGAGRLYDAGKNASKGFLKGLESQQKDLERVMERIAVAMQKALRKALGIKSPARAMIPDGINTARGVAVGVLQGLPHVDSAMQAVAGRMTGRAVAMRPVAGRAAFAGGGGQGQVLHVSVTFQGLVTDRTGTAKEIVEVINEYARNTGQPVKMAVAAA